MIDPKTVNELEVRLGGERVASLVRTPTGAMFRYDDAFLASDREPIAVHLPKATDGLEVTGLVNLPPFFANLLPEGVMQDAIVSSARLSRDDLFSQLALTAFDAVGDITVAVPGQVRDAPARTPRQAVSLLREIMAGHLERSFSTFSGIQPKISIGEAVASLRGATAIVKLEPESYPGLVVNEFYFTSLARHVGLNVPKVRLVDGALMAERFDRVKRADGPPIQVHVEDALQVMNEYPRAKYSVDFLEILDLVKLLSAPKVVVHELLRAYVFSHLIGNGDLHAKNVSFLYDRDRLEWRLSPLYDLVCTMPYFERSPYGRHMAISLGEQFGRFAKADFLSVADRYGIPAGPLSRSIDLMVSRIPAYLSKHPAPVNEAAVAEILDRCQALA